MKAINLISLLNAKKDLDDLNFKKYIEKSGINPNIREYELEDLESLVEQFSEKTMQSYIFNSFYVGFEIHQIGKEFDLLRIGENSVVNIELKRKSTVEKITKQLIQNHYYLNFLNVNVYNFTYEAATKKLYVLKDATTIEEVDFSVLIDKLQEQELMKIDHLHDLFDPTHYLVSPFSSPQAFMKDEYFLTTQQNMFKKEILGEIPTDKPVYVTIEGGPGTGKTLLTYDLAKDYLRNSKQVLIFHCGNMNAGHNTLIDDYGWPIEPVRNLNVYMDSAKYDLSQYDLIVFDEAQRIEKQQLKKFIEWTSECTFTCIFSYDQKQCLTSTEIKDNIPLFIEEQLNPKKCELKAKIRCTKEINAFIKNLFDLSERSPKQDYPNVSVQYFSTQPATKSYLQYLSEEGWKVIDFTPTGLNACPYDDYSINSPDNSHDIIGQEYDHVAAVIDDYFYYKPNNKLSTQGWSEKPTYHPTKMLYQNVTRARKKLHIVIINNPAVLQEILGILS